MFNLPDWSAAKKLVTKNNTFQRKMPLAWKGTHKAEGMGEEMDYLPDGSNRRNARKKTGKTDLSPGPSKK